MPTLAPGQRIGPYEILAAIGAGGMGEVYRATDPRLQREVAIKVSAETFNERFEREARAIASLNHINICTLHDIGPNYLVMELVEGPTLAQRIKQGPVPLDEALGIARQIADALEAAHEKGIVHRDLKPDNIKIKPDGTVKLLDFGLAKLDVDPAEPGATVTMGSTRVGTILGTPGYMSPEQARGKPADKRADIWAFGVVLYEMVTGQPVFEGETLSDSLAAVLTKEPDWSLAPLKVQPLLRRCLEKEPRRRLRDIGDAMALLDSAPLPSLPAAKRVQWLWPGIAAVLLISTLVISIVHFREQPPVAEQVQFRISLPPKTVLSASGASAVSPDGRKVAFFAIGADGAPHLWIRALDSLDARPLPDVQLDNRNPAPPFWSPDSRFLAFDDGAKLKKVEVAGGPPQLISELKGLNTLDGSWSRDGVIIIGTRTGVIQVSANGGSVSEVTKVDSSRKETYHLHPTFLPDGKHFLYTRLTDPVGNSGLFVASLEIKPQDQNSKQLLASPLGAVYSAGHLLFLRNSALLAQPFDLAKMELAGEPARVVENVGIYENFAIGLFSASANVLVYKAVASPDLALTWLDRQGKVLATVGEPGRFNVVAVASDGSRAAISQYEPGADNVDIWVHDLSQGTRTRFTFDPGQETQPIWSPDRSKIAFVARRGGKLALYQRASDGSGAEELLIESNQVGGLSDWSKDGRYLLFQAPAPGRTDTDVWLLPLTGERKPKLLVGGESNQLAGHISPDGRWVVYMSNESGRNEIYVQAFDSVSGSLSGGKWMVSRGALGMPRWRGDSKELFYLASDGSVMSVEVSPSSSFGTAAPTPLFQVPPVFIRTSQNPGTLADVTADGKRFLFAMPVIRSADEELTEVLNWSAVLKK